MSNNQNDIDRLINELQIQKSKDRKHMLRIEIAKATDRSVKKALQDILDDIERKEKRNIFFGLIILVIIVLIGFYFLGIKEERKKQDTSKVSTSKTSQKYKNIESEKVKQNTIKEKNLTEEEVKRWVSAVWDKRYRDIEQEYGYELNVRIDDKDNLVYIVVLPPKGIEVDSLGSFRINEHGELEESGYFIDGVNFNDWVVVSKKFMDVSDIESMEPITQMDEKEIKKVELSSEEFAELFVEWSKSELPVMSTSEYSEKYGHINEYDNSIIVITYNNSDDDKVSISEQTPYRMPEFYYTYDKFEKKAYRNRNNASGEKEFLPELTDYVNLKKNY